MTYGAFFGGEAPGGGGEPGAPVNLDTIYELIGFGAGNGTLVAGTTTHQKGAWVTLKAATVGDIAGFWLSPSCASGGSARFLVDLSFDGGATIAMPDIAITPGSTIHGETGPFFIPLNIPAGAHVAARVQASSTSASLRLAINGERRTAASRPLFDHCELLNAPASGTTYPSDIGLPLSGEWVEVNAATPRAYGALWATYGVQGAPTGQPIGLFVGKGAAAAETEIAGVISGVNSSGPQLRGGASILINQAIATGQRVVARSYGATVGGGDGLCVQIFGFYN